MKNKKILVAALSAGLVLGGATNVFAADDVKVEKSETPADLNFADLTGESGSSYVEPKEGLTVKEAIDQMNKMAEVKEAKDNNPTATTDDKEIKEALEASEKTLADADKDVDDAKANYEKKAEELNKANDKLHEAPKDKKVFTIDEYNAYSEAKEGFDKAQENVDKSFNDLSKLEDERKSKASDYGKANENKELALKEYEDKLSNLNSALEKLQKADEALKPKYTVKQAEENYAQKASKVDELASIVDAKLLAITEAKTNEEREAAINEYADASRNFDAANKELDQANNDLRISRSYSQGKVLGTMEQLAARSDAQDAYNTALSELNAQLEKIDEANKDVSTKELLLELADSNLKMAKELYQENVKALNKANEKLIAAPQGTTAYNQALKEFEKAQDNLNDALNKLSAAQDAKKRVNTKKEGAVWKDDLLPNVPSIIDWYPDGSDKKDDTPETPEKPQPRPDFTIPTPDYTPVVPGPVVVPTTDETTTVVPGPVVVPTEEDDKNLDEESKRLRELLEENMGKIDDLLEVNEENLEEEENQDDDDDNEIIDDNNTDPSDDNEDDVDPSDDDTDDSDDDDDAAPATDDKKVEVKKEVKKEAPKAAAKKSDNPKTGVVGMSAVISTMAISMAGIAATRKKEDR